ncbi:hypothetical protein BDA99DRAFT_533870 [Phascolomyces articulosus]|uniref:Tyr recombinase domain-containing protein n=1 Tax=Phascolomyces articulosus TaxID=60185 RepID=A0AAD5PI80_9FUNG|nr:hypothetical protein BDA99DRAFT_533870 [Phascolomyces articulosus]
MVLSVVDVKEGGSKDSLPNPRLQENQDLCPVACTARYRSSTTDKLFISSIPPHANISGDRLRNWFKLAMAGANISDDHTVHSVHAEVITTALELGANIDDILASGYWSRRSTFERFYHMGSSTKPQQSAEKRNSSMAALNIKNPRPAKYHKSYMKEHLFPRSSANTSLSTIIIFGHGQITLVFVHYF